MNQLQKIDKFISRVEKILVIIGLVVLISTVFLAAVLRFFGIDMSVSTDLAQLVFAWTSFIGASLAIRSNSHMGMEFLREKFNPKIQSTIRVFCDVLMLLFLIILLIYGFKLVIANPDRKYNTLGISYSFATASCPIGALLMITGVVNNLIQDIKSFKEA